MRVLIACCDSAVGTAFLDSLKRADISALAAPPDLTLVLGLARRHRPEVVLLDDELPGLDGVAGLHRLVAASPGSRIVMITGRDDEEWAVRAILAGAAGYLGSEVAPVALPRVVRAVMRGEVAIPRSLTIALIELARGERGMRPIRSALTPREWEVLDLLTTGASTQKISNELVVSIDTVQSHIKHILRKLRVHSRAEAVARAHELRRHYPDSTEK
jgi:two-component system, NarL family, response regulator LiaR